MKKPESRSAKRSQRFSVASLAIAAVLGAACAILAPATIASATSPTPTPAPGSSTSHHKPLAMGTFSTSDYAGAAKRLPHGLTIALSRDVHLTGAEYLADADADARAVKVVASLKAAGVKVVGSKMQGSRLTVDVASSSDVATVESTGAAAHVGAPKTPDFGKIKFHSVASTDIYGGEGYFFYSTKGQNSGSGSGDLCSIGFNGYSVSTGAPQFVTAGHCQTAIPSGNSVFIRNQTTSGVNDSGPLSLGAALGTAVAGEGKYGSGSDYGIISAGDSGVVAHDSVATWGGNDGSAPSTGGPTSSTPLTITDEMAATAGDTLCKSGSTTGWTCGVVEAVDYPVDVSGQTVNSIVATTCLIPGDSGGGAVDGSYAIGIDSGSDFPQSSTDTEGGDVSLPNGYPCGNPNSDPAAGVDGDDGYQSVFFPMVSAAGSDSVQGQQGSNWQLAVAVSSTATVTSPSPGGSKYASSSMTGTVSSPTSNSTALLYLDGSTSPYAEVSASTGSWSIPLAGVSPGTHTYSLSAGLGWSPGTPVTGTFTLLADPAPIGVIDTASTGPQTVSVVGWMLALGTTGPIQVGVTLDGVTEPAVTANLEKSGLGAAFPGYGDDHGYSVSLTSVSGGAHTVCVYGMNPISGGPNQVPLCQVVQVPTGSPFGVIDSATAAPGSLTVTGWMVDPDTASSIQVGVTLDGVAQSTITANGVKTGLGAALPGYGDNHDYTDTLSVSGGSHSICVYGINVGGGSNSKPICASVAVPTGSPIGVIDTVTTVPGSLTVAGWMLDPDTVSAIQVGVTLDGVAQSMITANVAYTGFGAAFPGYGDNHGYTDTLTVSGGTHTICVYGINVGNGSNGSPVCRTVTIPTGSPIGVIDTATAAPGSVTVSGWMLDYDTVNAIQVGVTLDGVAQSMITANVAYTGFGAAFPGYGDNHGYTDTLTVSGGTHTICVYGINVGNGSNGSPICRTLAAPTGSPFGVIDSATATASTISLNGWFIDPDTASAISVEITLDGVVVPPNVVANGAKTGLNAAFPGYGDDHDYSTSLAESHSGSHTVCVIGLNVGGGSNSSPVCSTVTTPSS